MSFTYLIIPFIIIHYDTNDGILILAFIEYLQCHSRTFSGFLGIPQMNPKWSEKRTRRFWRLLHLEDDWCTQKYVFWIFVGVVFCHQIALSQSLHAVNGHCSSGLRWDLKWQQERFSSSMLTPAPEGWWNRETIETIQLSWPNIVPGASLGLHHVKPPWWNNGRALEGLLLHAAAGILHPGAGDKLWKTMTPGVRSN